MGITAEIHQAHQGDDDGRHAKVMQCGLISPSNGNTSRKYRLEELLNLKDDLDFQTCEQLCFKFKES